MMDPEADRSVSVMSENSNFTEESMSRCGADLSWVPGLVVTGVAYLVLVGVRDRRRLPVTEETVADAPVAPVRGA